MKIILGLLLMILFSLQVWSQSCEVEWDDRIDCRKGTQSECENAGCCWDPSYSGGPAWCFYKAGVQPGVPVFVMLQLDIVDPANPTQLAYPDKLRTQLTKLKSVGVVGVMCDFWWGVVEQQPGQYVWSAYLQLAEMCVDIGLKFNVVASFHQCGGNVGDSCNIPIPSWVRSVSGVYYKDQWGAETKEYISHAADNERLFNGRTPIELYRDYLASFAQAFDQYLTAGDIMEIELGAGPSGELRYPAYQLDKWTFPGVGAFQAFDNYMLAQLKAQATSISKPEWGYPPTNAGGYNSKPEDTQFFSNNQQNNWNSEYGQFFLDFYSSSLIAHGERIFNAANTIFDGYPVSMSFKISGVHWLYNTDSHAAELTAGYYNTAQRDGYGPISRMLLSVNGSFDFTCLEMRNSEQTESARSNPEQLVAQTRGSAESHSIKYRGENALARYDSTAYDQIVKQSRFSNGEPIDGFTYLRLTDELINNSQFFNTFAEFVVDMQAISFSNATKIVRY